MSGMWTLLITGSNWSFFSLSSSGQWLPGPLLSLRHHKSGQFSACIAVYKSKPPGGTHYTCGITRLRGKLARTIFSLRWTKPDHGGDRKWTARNCRTHKCTEIAQLAVGKALEDKIVLNIAVCQRMVQIKSDRQSQTRLLFAEERRWNWAWHDITWQKLFHGENNRRRMKWGWRIKSGLLFMWWKKMQKQQPKYLRRLLDSWYANNGN